MKPTLPEGTDTIIDGASNDDGTVTTDDTASVAEREIPAPRAMPSAGHRQRQAPRADLPTACAAAARSSPSQAGDRARGLVSQGLERTAEALANVAQDGRRHRDRAR